MRRIISVEQVVQKPVWKQRTVDVHVQVRLGQRVPSMLNGVGGCLPLVALAADSSLRLIFVEDSGRDCTRYHVEMRALFGGRWCVEP